MSFDPDRPITGPFLFDSTAIRDSHNRVVVWLGFGRGHVSAQLTEAQRTEVGEVVCAALNHPVVGVQYFKLADEGREK